MASRSGLACRSICFLAVTGFAQFALAAGSPLDSFGFEGYAAGALAGQQAVGYPGLTWAGIGSFNSNGAATQTGVNKAVIQTAVKQSGTKALKVERTAGIDNRWAVPLGGLPVLPSHRFLLIDWDMNVSGTGAENGGVGPFFGIEAYDDVVPASAPIGLLGSLGVDATTAEVIYQLQDSGDFANTGATISFDEWNHFGMVFDFTLRQYSVYMNGTRLKATGFVDRDNAAVNQITDADIAALAAYSDSNSRNMVGTAYFDNFRILDGVPGDFDFDGDTDSADLGLWKTAFKTTAVGDADGDGDTDGSDFMIWQQNAGTDVTPAVAATGAVPEPSAAALMAFASFALARLRRRALSPLAA